MSTTLRLTLFAVLAATVLMAWYSGVAHLYNPTVRTPLPLPHSTHTPTPAELSARIYALPPH